MNQDRPIRVMMSTIPPEDRTNPYITMLAHSVDVAPVSVKFISWRELLLGRVDVFHIHWPERLIAGKSAVRRLVKRLALLMLLMLRRLLGVKIVRTMHNLRPHDGAHRLDRWILHRVDRATDFFVYLNDAVERPANSCFIPHGHYRDWYGGATAVPTTGTFLLCGLLRPYKGIEPLIEAARAAPELKIEIAGYAPDSAYAALIVQLAADVPQVTVRAAHLEDDELVAAVSRSEGVVLPYPSLYNSGVLFLALSLGRPVVVPAGGASDSYAGEFGEEWIARFSQPLTGDGLRRAVEHLRSRSPRRDVHGPAMLNRDWNSIGEAHRDLYARLVRR